MPRLTPPPALPPGEGDGGTNEEDQSNSALMAAAPELADALEEADRIIRELWAMAQQFNVPDGCHWPELKQSERRAALKRAGR